MQKSYPFARLVFGLALFVFGLNGFLGFLPTPPMAERGLVFLRALIDTGYMLPFWKGTEVICGALLLSNRYVPLAAVLIAPVTLNIFFYHLFLDQRNLVLGVLMLTLNVIVIVKHWGKYRPLFTK